MPVHERCSRSLVKDARYVAAPLLPTRNAMNPIKLPQSKPGVTPRSSDRRRLLWAFVTALTTTAALGVVVPRVAAHGNAQASVIFLSSASPAIPDSTVPAASGVFVGNVSGPDGGAPAPTF